MGEDTLFAPTADAHAGILIWTVAKREFHSIYSGTLLNDHADNVIIPLSRPIQRGPKRFPMVGALLFVSPTNRHPDCDHSQRVTKLLIELRVTRRQ